MCVYIYIHIYRYIYFFPPPPVPAGFESIFSKEDCEGQFDVSTWLGYSYSIKQ